MNQLNRFETPWPPPETMSALGPVTDHDRSSDSCCFGVFGALRRPIGGNLTSVSCTGSSFCATVDKRGNAYTYNGSSWSAAPNLTASYRLQAVSCPTSTFCLTGDNNGDVYTYNGSSWGAANQSSPLTLAPDHILVTGNDPSSH